MNTSKIAIQKAGLSLFNLSNHHAPEEESKKQKPKNIVRSFSGQVCSFFKFIHKNLS
jgi:D-lyxose ketol-isomerase